MSTQAISSQTTETPIEQAFLQMFSSYWVSQAIYVAAKLGIADLLAEGPRKVEELAVTTHTHPASLYRLLRALTSVGVFAEGDDKAFSLTPMAAPLKKG